MKILTSEQYNALDTDLKNLYQEKEGQYELAAVPRTVNNGTLEAKRKAEERARQYEGIDPEKARKALETLEQLESQELLKKGDVEGLLGKERAKLNAEREKERKSYEDRLSASDKALSVLLRDNALRAAAAELGVLPGAMDDVLLHGERAFRVENGQLLSSVEGGESDPKKWLKEQLGKRKHWLGASAGGDTPPKGGSGAPRGNLKRSEMSFEQKAAYQKEHGMDAYNKLPK